MYEQQIKKILIDLLPTQKRGKKGPLQSPRFTKVEERSSKEIPQLCNIAGKQKGHLCDAWMRSGMRPGSSCGNFMRHF